MNYKILIVDDDSDIREILSYNLSKEGFVVETAADGIIAIDKSLIFKHGIGIDQIELKQLKLR